MAEKRVLTVTQLNMYVKSLLESSVYLNEIYITGEISNFTDHYKTGHMYMSLKDDGGLIKAVMFRQYASKLGFRPQSGMKVVCRGKVSLYERDGQYQLYITAMRPQGMGELAVAYEQLKSKLENEGLFDSSLKRPIPKIPKRIAVITSPTGAAVQDIMNILSRRFPIAEVIMCPVQVQGEAAAPQMIDALKRVNALNCADVIIIGRGGGSIEDLWAFNDEQLARTVRASNIPVISAVGHETDFTICDFTADLRAPTPSGAAELAVPESAEIIRKLKNVNISLYNSLVRLYRQKQLMLRAIMNKQCMANPLFYAQQRSQTVDMLTHRLGAAYANTLSQSKERFAATAANLESLSPMKVLLRGYSVVYKDGGAVVRSSQLAPNDKITLKMCDGEVNAVVE